MTVAEAIRPGGGIPAATGGASAPAGRVDVRERVVRKVSEQIASQVIGVDVDRVTVTASDYRGGVAVRIQAPMPVPSLDDTAAVQAHGAIVDIARDAQHRVQEQLGRVLGRTVTRVDITVDGATVPVRRRVR
ncbi:MAG: NTP pyrophosphohydrolase [Microbacterium arborescens]